MRLFLSRWLCTSGGENAARLEREADEAVGCKADIAVFPELFLTGYRGSFDPAAARRMFEDISLKKKRVVFLFGSISEDGRNRATMWLGGKEVLSYDKVHLFRPNGEHLMWKKGSGYKAVATPRGRAGVIICNDLRFPEAARALRLREKIDILLVPALWPWRRDQVWKSLLRARAIENACYVAGCCLSHLESDGEKFFGAGNYVFDPLGETVGTADDRIYDLELPFKGRILVDPLEDR